MKKVFENPYYKKIKGSLLCTLTCSHCKSHLLNYQKVGKGNVLILHVERIIDASFDCFKLDKVLKCPTCGQELGIVEQKKHAYRMMRAQTTQKFIY